MIDLTIRDIKEDRYEYDPGHCLYMVHYGDTIFYIGRSTDPGDRIMQHMGMGKTPSLRSSLGELIFDNMPESWDWYVQFASLADFGYGELSPLMHELEVDTVERRLIAKLHPCLNVTYNRFPGELPDRYNKHPIENEGMV